MAKAKTEQSNIIKAGDEVQLPDGTGIVLPSDQPQGEGVVSQPSLEVVTASNVGKTVPIEDIPLVTPKVARAIIEVPVDEQDAQGHVTRFFNFRLSHAEAVKLKQLCAYWHRKGVTYFDGRIQRHVDKPHDGLRCLLAQVEVA